jgi:uracil-DNA glycosylase
LADRVEHERSRDDVVVYPPVGETFAAFAMTSMASARVVILGQDPYHGAGQAHGLSFSVRPPTPPPPSLKNIYRELNTDLGITTPSHGDLSAWARSGVLLLNSSLTVQAGEPNSHRRLGWEVFTDAVIAAIACRTQRCVFILWGAPAQKKRQLIDATIHAVIESPHPSPLAAHRGFFGSRPFSRANEYLRNHQLRPIDWTIE